MRIFDLIKPIIVIGTWRAKSWNSLSKRSSGGEFSQHSIRQPSIWLLRIHYLEYENAVRGGVNRSNCGEW